MSAQGSMGIQHNMRVYTVDAAPVGTVKQIRENEILVDREKTRDVLIPLMFVGEVLLEERRVELEVTEDEFNERTWEHPPLL
jgi:ribosomal 30S subunit maturation factor RimM